MRQRLPAAAGCSAPHSPPPPPPPPSLPPPPAGGALSRAGGCPFAIKPSPMMRTITAGPPFPPLSAVRGAGMGGRVGGWGKKGEGGGQGGKREPHATDTAPPAAREEPAGWAAAPLIGRCGQTRGAGGAPHERRRLGRVPTATRKTAFPTCGCRTAREVDEEYHLRVSAEGEETAVGSGTAGGGEGGGRGGKGNHSRQHPQSVARLCQALLAWRPTAPAWAAIRETPPSLGARATHCGATCMYVRKFARLP